VIEAGFAGISRAFPVANKPDVLHYLDARIGRQISFLGLTQGSRRSSLCPGIHFFGGGGGGGDFGRSFP
jgi:hypothetical protein